jgi:hypothetical protein
MTKDSQIGRHWEKTRARMLPKDQVEPPEPKNVF